MKKRFNKSSVSLFGFFLLSILSVVIAITVLIQAMLIENNYSALIIITFIICLLMPVILFFSARPKNIFGIVLLSDEGIEWKLFKKQIMFIKWDEIINMDMVRRGPIQELIRIAKDKKYIDLEPTKNIYNSFIAICPIPHLVWRIENLGIRFPGNGKK
jgi:hypothetical protein